MFLPPIRCHTDHPIFVPNLIMSCWSPVVCPSPSTIDSDSDYFSLFSNSIFVQQLLCVCHPKNPELFQQFQHEQPMLRLSQALLQPLATLLRFCEGTCVLRIFFSSSFYLYESSFDLFWTFFNRFHFSVYSLAYRNVLQALAVLHHPCALLVALSLILGVVPGPWWSASSAQPASPPWNPGMNVNCPYAGWLWHCFWKVESVRSIKTLRESMTVLSINCNYLNWLSFFLGGELSPWQVGN
jgi:hypothetical protein